MKDLQLLDDFELLPESGKFYDERRWDIRVSLWDETYAYLELGPHDGAMTKIIDLENDREFYVSVYTLRRLINVQKVFRIELVGDDCFLFFFEGNIEQERKVCIVKVELYDTKPVPTTIMEQIGGARRTIFMPNDKVLYDSARTGWAIFDLKTTKTCSFYGIKLKQPQNLSFEYYRGREKDILLMYYTISEGDYSENIYTLIDAQNFQAAEAIYNTYDEQTIIPKADSDVEELFKIEEERIRKKLEVKVSKNKLAKLGQICELVSGEIPSA